MEVSDKKERKKESEKHKKLKKKKKKKKKQFLCGGRGLEFFFENGFLLFVN